MVFWILIWFHDRILLFYSWICYGEARILFWCWWCGEERILVFWHWILFGVERLLLLWNSIWCSKGRTLVFWIWIWCVPGWCYVTMVDLFGCSKQICRKHSLTLISINGQFMQGTSNNSHMYVSCVLKPRSSTTGTTRLKPFSTQKQIQKTVLLTKNLLAYSTYHNKYFLMFCWFLS